MNQDDESDEETETEEEEDEIDEVKTGGYTELEQKQKTQNKGKQVIKSIAAWTGCFSKDKSDYYPISICTCPVKFNTYLGSNSNIENLKLLGSKEANKQQIYGSRLFYIIEH